MKAKHVWYRIYQGVMRIAANFLNFTPPKLIEGPGSIRQLPAFMKSLGISRVLIVTDKGLMSLRLLDGLFDGLKEAGIAYRLYDGVQPNPTIPNIEEAVRLYLADQCQAIIAFGGGSSMDCAKGAGARVVNPGKTIPRMRGLLKVTRKLPPLFAVPTTAGTGSETTLAAVITDPSTHEKYAINDPRLIPPYAVLDPELTLKLPPNITATTGMDALTHAVEAYIGGSNTRNTFRMAEKAVELIFSNLEKVYADGSDIEKRGNMLKASFCAGIAFTRAYVGYVHAIAHNLGGLYGIAHGLANAVILPHVLEFFGESAHYRLARLADIADIAKPGDSDGDKARAFIEAIKGMNRRMGIQEKFPQIREEDIPLLIDRAFREAHPLYPVPRFMEREDCERIIRRLMP